MSGYVYFASFEPNFVKIGYSYSPLQRLRQIQIFKENLPDGVLPSTGKIVKAIKGTMKDERAMQRQFCALPGHPEWFRNSRKLRNFIDTLPDIDLPPVPPREDDGLVFAGARIDAALWARFAGNAKATGKSVAEALEAALRAALPANGKQAKR